MSYHSLEDKIVKGVFQAGSKSSAPLGFPVELEEHKAELKTLTKGTECPPPQKSPKTHAQPPPGSAPGNASKPGEPHEHRRRQQIPVTGPPPVPCRGRHPVGPARKSRTPLSARPLGPPEAPGPFVVLCFGLLALALMAVLVLNISVSSAQYQLVELRGEQSTLTKQNQDLTQQVQNFDAPQNLAAKATELGMVASTVKGQIDLSTLTVTGKAKPAVKGDAPAPSSPRRPSPASSPWSRRPRPMSRCEPQARRDRHRLCRRAAAAPAARPRPHRPAGRGTARRLRSGPGAEGPGKLATGPTTSQANSKETSWRRTPARHARQVPSATRRLRLGLGIMLALLLVVGGKLFLVQGLDVGGMADAASKKPPSPYAPNSSSIFTRLS